MGRLLRWFGDRAEADGLADAAMGDLVEIAGSGPALVAALHRDVVELAPLLSPRPDAASVRRLGPLVTPVGDALLGRVVDAVGAPIDGGPRIAHDSSRRILERNPVLMKSVEGRLTLGALVFDLQRLFPFGTSLLALRPTRGRDLADHLVRHQLAAGRTCVVACLTGTGLDMPIPLDAHAARRITVSPGEHATQVARWLVPWTAMAIAAEFRDRADHVVVILDDVEAWRSPVRRMAVRGSWPTQLAQLASRAYAGPKGSVSLIALCRERDRELAASVDGEIDLHAFARGDLGPTTTKLVRPPIRVLDPARLGGVCLALSLLCDVERTPWLEDGADPLLRRMLADGRRYRECLRFRPGGSVDSLEQLAALLAVIHTEVDAFKIGPFVEAFLLALRRDAGDRLAAIRLAKFVDAADRAALVALAQSVARSFVSA